jgi:hypothetical protein
MPILQTNVLPIREVVICDGWCSGACWKLKTIPPWVWCDAVHDFSKCQIIDTPNAFLAEARQLIQKKNEGLFLFYQLGDLEGARRYKEKIAKVQRYLEKYN